MNLFPMLYLYNMMILFTFVALPAIVHGGDEIQDYTWKYLIVFH